MKSERVAGFVSESMAGFSGIRNLTGLSSRWDPIAATNGKIVSIIIKPGDAGDGLSFRALLTNVIAIVSEEPRDAHPLPADGPLISMTMKGVNNEAMALGPARMFWVRRVWIFLETVLAVLCDRMGVKIGGFDARLYKIEIVENSDFRKFDDGLKMTVDIDANRFARLETALEEASASGLCQYGLHRQKDALMTCFVPSLQAKEHVHFIDGAGGGYALASSNLKKRSPNPENLPPHAV